MVLTYRFKKFKLEDGTYTKRPIVDVILKNNDKSLEFGAILDSGSDITTIPKAAAEYLELKIDDKEVDMVGYKGTGKVKGGKVTIIFKGKAQRQDEILSNVPIEVMQDTEEEDVILGILGIFEHFRITFNDTQNIVITILSHP